jgi:CRP-like cAMP-binding protein
MRTLLALTSLGPCWIASQVYIVLHGIVKIMKGSLELTRLQHEQGTQLQNDIGLPIFGEMAMIDRKPRMAAAVAESDCKLLVLPSEQFLNLMVIVPDIKARLRRLKETRRVQNTVDERRRTAK